MPRILLTIVLPLLLPTALYLVWVTVLRPARHDGATQWAALPWLWLAGAGMALLAIVPAADPLQVQRAVISETCISSKRGSCSSPFPLPACGEREG